MKNKLKSALKTLKNFNDRERGSAFPIVLVMLLITGLMIPPLLSLISTSLTAGKVYEDNSKELYAADAGVMDAAQFLQTLEVPGKGIIDPMYLDDPDCFGPGGTGIYTDSIAEKINGLNVSYEIEYDGGGFVITSFAKDDNGDTQTTVETRVNYQPALPPIVVAAGALDGTLRLGASAVVGEGNEEDESDDSGWVNTYSDGNTQVIGGGIIWGDCFYTPESALYGPNSLDLYGGSILHGNALKSGKMKLQDDALPDKPTDEWDGAYPATIQNQTRDLGPIYIDGDLHIGAKADVTLTGVVWVKGRVIIDSTAYVHSAEGAELEYIISEECALRPAAMLLRDYYADYTPVVEDFAIAVSGQARVDAILYSKKGAVYVAGTSALDGSAIGLDAVILGTCDLTNPLPFERVEIPYRPMVTNYWKII